jgi:hypothetical protein
MMKKTENKSELTLWERAIETNSPEAYNQYLNEYPQGKFVILAREKLKKLSTIEQDPAKDGSDQIDPDPNTEYNHLLSQAEQAIEANDLTRAKEFVILAKKIMSTPELLEVEKKISTRERQLLPHARLRQVPREINTVAIQSMLKKRGFFDTHKNRFKRFHNQFSLENRSGKNVVVDRSTGLMWHHSGSTRYMSLPMAQSWISNLNRSRYAGYSDWRLPTIEEAASLMEVRKNSHGLHLNPLFSGKTRSIWTSDTLGQQYWIVYFDHGYVDVNWPQFNGYIRPVRAMY